jgi:hypothetical protein
VHLKFLDTIFTHTDKHRVRSVTMLTTEIQHDFHSQAVLLECEDENNRILRNVGDCLHNDTALTSQTIWIFSNTAVRTSTIAILIQCLGSIKHYSTDAIGGSEFLVHVCAILNLCTRLRWVVSFTFPQLYHGEWAFGTYYD